MSKGKSRIGFWSKPSNNLLSHGKGLTEDDIKFLQSLKVGDRLIMWDNSKRNEGTNSPTHMLTLYEQLRTTLDNKGEKKNAKDKSKSLLD